MKTMKTNGQVLSEKEMREVKGGHITYSTDLLGFDICEECGASLVGLKAEPIAGLGYRVKCIHCGSIIEIKSVKEEE